MAPTFVEWPARSQDVRRIREHPLVPGHIPIHAFIYMHSGRLVEVKGAAAAGRAF